MRPFRLFSSRATPLIFFTIALLVSAGIVSLNRVLDKSNRGDHLLTSVRALAYKISAAEWKMISEKVVDEETEQVFSETRIEITQTIEQVIALDPKNSDVLSASAAIGEYLKWLDEEIQLIKSSNMEEALRIDGEKVDPTFERLSESLTSAQATFNRRSEQIRIVVNIGSAIFILAAAAIMAAFWSQNQRDWARIMQANVERNALTQATKHSEELEVYAQRLNRHNTQLEASAFISRQAVGIQDISELITTAANLTAERFGYSHVGVYILNEQKKIAFLQASSSSMGKDLIEQGFSVEINNFKAFKFVVEQRIPYIMKATAPASLAKDINFPLMQSRMIVPMIVRNNTIGVLDLHANLPQAFDIQDAEILQSLTDLIAISFDNARLINETGSLLSQLEIITSIQTERTWRKLTSRQKPAYQYTLAGVRPVFSTNKKYSNDGLLIPLVLHGQKIGEIKLKREGGISQWSKRERILVEKIADQVALALENSRLVDEAQKSAARDQMIANVSTRVRETLDIESVVRTAASELRKVFDLKEAEISVGSPQIESALPARKNTGTLRVKG